MDTVKSRMPEHVAEALIGLLVVIVACFFVWFAWNRTGGGAKAGAIHVIARFPNAGGVNLGTDVKVAGLKIGNVVDQQLDPQTFQVRTTLAIDPSVKIPADSSAAITSEGLLGANYIQLQPGGDPTPLKDGDTISDTQGAVDLMGMVGQFINRSGGSSASSPANGEAGKAPAPANP